MFGTDGSSVRLGALICHSLSLSKGFTSRVLPACRTLPPVRLVFLAAWVLIRGERVALSSLGLEGKNDGPFSTFLLTSIDGVWDMVVEAMT